MDEFLEKLFQNQCWSKSVEYFAVYLLVDPGNVVSVNSSFSFLRFLSVFFQLFFLFSSWASYVFVSVSVSVFFPFSVPGLER